jgi:hypothetical protein
MDSELVLGGSHLLKPVGKGRVYGIHLLITVIFTNQRIRSKNLP